MQKKKIVVHTYRRYLHTTMNKSAVYVYIWRSIVHMCSYLTYLICKALKENVLCIAGEGRSTK